MFRLNVAYCDTRLLETNILVSLDTLQPVIKQPILGDSITHAIVCTVLSFPPSIAPTASSAQLQSARASHLLVSATLRGL